MSAAVQERGLLIERAEDRVHYLAEQRDWGIQPWVPIDKGTSYEVQAAVIRFLNKAEVVLQLRTGGFSFQNGISPTDARLLALALNVAADEADASLDEVQS